MLRRILGAIQTNKLPPLVLVRLRHREFRIHEPHKELGIATERLERVRAAQNHVHATAEFEVFEKGYELNDLVLLDDLKPCKLGFEALVDGDDHAPAGNGEAGGEAEGEVLVGY